MSDYSVRAKLGIDDQLSGPLKEITGQIGAMAASFAALAGAGYVLKQLVGRGMEFNKTMEDTRGGIAGVLLATKDFVDAGGKVLTGQKAVNAAFVEAKGLQKDLVVDASKTAASYTELATAFQSALAPAAAAGVSSLTDVREITVMATQAMTALGIPTVQAAQEVRGLFSGDVGPDNRLNQIIRVTRADLEKVRGNGEATAAMFKERLGPFAAAAAMQTGTLTVRLSNLGDVLDSSLGTATEGLFKGLSTLIGEISAGVGDAAGAFEDLKGFLGGIFEVLVEVGKSIRDDLTGSLADAGLSWRDFFRIVLTGFMGFVEMIGSGVKYLGQLLTSPLETIWGGWKALFFGLASMLSEFLLKLSQKLVDIPFVGEFFEAWSKNLDALVVDMTTVDARFDSFQKKAEANFGAGALAKTKGWLDSLDAAATGAGDAAERMGTRTKKAADELGEALFYAGQGWRVGAAEIAAAADKARMKVDSFMGGTQEAAAKIRAEGAAIVSALGDALMQGGLSFEEFSALLVKVTKKTTDEVAKLAFEGGEAAVEGFIYPLRDNRAALSESADNILGVYSDVANGIKAAMLKIRSEIRTEAESTAGYVLKTYDTLSKGFEDVVFATISGRTKDLGDLMQGIFDQILQSWASMVSDMVKRWLDGSDEIAGATGGKGTGDVSTGGGILAGVGTILGGVGVARAVGGGSGGRQTGAYIGAGLGMAGGIVLGMTGGAIAAAVGGTASGMTLGATMGSVVPIIGTIVGAILGAALGSLLAGSSEKKVKFEGATVGYGRGPTGQYLAEKKSGLLGGLADIFEVGAPDMKAALMGWASDQMTGVLRSMNVTAHAGSGDDLQKDIDSILETEVPKWMIREAFGQKATGKFPELPGIKGIPEFVAGSFSKESPIGALLDGLGVTADRMREIALQIDSRTPEAFMAYLSSFVAVVAGFRDLTKDLGKTVDEVWSDASAREKKTPVEGFREQASKLVDLAKELSLYAGDEQIKRAQQLQQLVAQYRDAEIAYLEQLRALSVKLTEGLAAQADAYADALNPKTGTEQLAQAWDDVWSGWGKLYSATDGAAVEEVATEMSGAIDFIFQQMMIRVQAGKILFEDLTTLAGSFGSLEADVQKGISREKDPIGAMQADAADLHRQAAEAAKLSGAEQLEAIAKIRDAGTAAYAAQARLLDQIARQASALRTSIEAQKWEIDLAGMDGKGQAQSIADRIKDLRQRLSTTNSADEAQRITSEIQGLIGRYLGQFKEGDVELGNAREWAKNTLDDLLGVADDVYARLAEETKKTADLIRADLEEMARLAKANVDEASGAIEGLSGTLRALGGVVEEVLKKLGEDVTAENNPLRLALAEAGTLFTNAATTIVGGLTGDEGIDPAIGRTKRAFDQLSDTVERLNGILGGPPPETTPKGGEGPNSVATVAPSARVSPAAVLSIIRRYPAAATAARVG